MTSLRNSTLPSPGRRRLLAGAAGAMPGFARLGGLAGLAGCASVSQEPPRPAEIVQEPPKALNELALLDDLESRTFRFFWETADPTTGMIPDRWPGNPAMASIASVGFGLTALLVGAERGLVTREQAAERAHTTLAFLANARQGTAQEGTSGYRGFFYHFLHVKTGERFSRRTELSTIDTALLMGGVLAVQSYFDQPSATESNIRTLAEQLYTRVDWRWAQLRGGLIAMGWSPETGFQRFIDYRGYDEAMLLVLLAMASPTYPARDDSWQAFTKTYPRLWGTFMDQTYLAGAPLFWHQYSHVWVDFRGVQDDFMRKYGIDYFENSRRATKAQRAYAIANPGKWKGYGENIWGFTACDGPGKLWTADHAGVDRQFLDYSARGVGLIDTLDDGTLAPTAAAASIPFTPAESTAAVREMHGRYGAHIYGRYGFLDAFNPSFTDSTAKLSDGRVAPGFGWVATDYLGIDQGPIVAMIANHRQDLVWRAMRSNVHIRRGLRRADFSGGWLETPASA